MRNSADHGIEPPDDREAAGKPRQGTVTLNAFHRGNSIVIEVRDDGKGLDTGRILRKALDQGLLTEADAQRMTPRQIQQLIWNPGLSTAEKVTDISGRGMGMDIVKTKIENLSGTIDIDSEQGKGTTITIKLPLTLAILPSLMVDIDGAIFAMPMEAVTEIVSIGRDHIRTVHGRPMATVRGRVIPFGQTGRHTELSRCRRARSPPNRRGHPGRRQRRRARKSVWPSIASSAKKTWSSSRSPNTTKCPRNRRRQHPRRRPRGADPRYRRP